MPLVARAVRRRRSLGAVLSAVILALLAGCASTVTGAPVLGAALPQASGGTSALPTAPGGITVPSGGPGGGQTSAGSSSVGSGTSPQPSSPVPAGLEKFYGQQLAWGGCSDYATSSDDKKYYADSSVECARLTVPLAYDDPTGKTITIGVLRNHATDQSKRIGSLLFNPGGPGASGMSLVAQLAVAHFAPDLNAFFDFVGFDPRGVGSAQPAVDCLTDAERDEFRTKDPRSNTAAAVAAANEVQSKIAADCVARTGSSLGIDGKTFLTNVGTRDVARDLDVLRAALGDGKLSYVGYSYGTRIGYVYAEQFPTNIRAMILDGVTSSDEGPEADLLGQAKGFQDAFNDFAQWCATKQTDCPLGKDSNKATSVYQSLVRPLLDQPIKTSDGRPLTFTDANTGTIEAMYSESLRPQLAKALTALKQGNGDAQMELADEYNQRDASGQYSTLQDAFNAIRCQDESRITDPAEITRINAEYAKAAPFTDSGDPPGAIDDICSLWPVQPTWTPHKLSIPNMPKVLVVSTKGDPATPYQNGVDLAGQINAALLSVEGTRHTSYLLSGIACADKIGNTYLETLALPSAGTDCSS